MAPNLVIALVVCGIFALLVAFACLVGRKNTARARPAGAGTGTEGGTE